MNMAAVLVSVVTASQLPCAALGVSAGTVDRSAHPMRVCQFLLIDVLNVRYEDL
jgi:hypothetical protein